MANREWHRQGDWQVGRIDGKWVVLARGGTYSNRRREDLSLHVVATCRDDLDAERIVSALRYTDNESACGQPPPDTSPELPHSGRTADQ